MHGMRVASRQPIVESIVNFQWLYQWRLLQSGPSIKIKVNFWQLSLPLSQGKLKAQYGYYRCVRLCRRLSLSRLSVYKKKTVLACFLTISIIALPVLCVCNSYVWLYPWLLSSCHDSKLSVWLNWCYGYYPLGNAQSCEMPYFLHRANL